MGGKNVEAVMAGSMGRSNEQGRDTDNNIDREIVMAVGSI